MKELYTFADLENWEKATRGISPPIRLGVLGYPIAHSLSPQMQNAALKASGIAMQYARFQIAPNELRTALARMRELGFVGCNLTVPHKLAGFDLVDKVKGGAEEIGAINTIAFDDQLSLGWNTDGPGFERAIREVFEVDLRDLRVLVLGTGGAGRAIAWECALQNCAQLVLANRDFQKAQELACKIGETIPTDSETPLIQVIPAENSILGDELEQTDLLVHATSLGLKASDALPLPAYLLGPRLMVYDLNYQTAPTPLQRAAEQAGARHANGLTTLLHQGALAFEHWFNQPAPLGVMREALGLRATTQKEL